MGTLGTSVVVGGRTLTLTNLDKVLYPAVGFTKSEVIDYYARVAPTMLDHTAGRCMTFKRYPNGVDGKSFFEKRCPSHRPEWVPVAIGPGDRNGTVEYCRLEEPAALAWSANLAALELHAPMARSDDLENPLMCVFDLDPGPKTGIPQCAALALEIRDVLAAAGLESLVKTSGSKGMQLYVPLNSHGPDGHTHDHTGQFALAVGQLLEKRHPETVTTTMAKVERPGKVFVDWSQNARFKTTICVYSLRAREHPTVSTPVTWDEVSDAADGSIALRFEAGDVLDRIAEHGDLFADAVDLEQHLPRPKAS